MEIGDLVRCRPRSEDENYDAWLGLIIGEGLSGHKTVQWVCSDVRTSFYHHNLVRLDGLFIF